MTSSSLSNLRCFTDRARAFWLAGLCLGALPLPVHAFSDPARFGKYPEEEGGLGGGGGRFFTGSPADGYGCSVCHKAKENYSFPVTITGLPKAGYIPGKTYTVKLTWPEASVQTTQAMRNGLKPLSSVVAEFLSEGGGSSGTLQFQAGVLLTADDACLPELAHVVAPTSTDDDEQPTGGAATMMTTMAVDAGPPAEFAGHLYVANRGAPVFEQSSSTCDISDDPERRCIATIRPCGAKQLVLKWTAPAKWKSPIWFSLGFVATYDATSRPDDNDYVTEMSIPLNPASEGATYESELSGGCSVTAPRASSNAWLSGGVLLACGTALRLRKRRRTLAARSGKASGLWLLAALGLIGCQTAPELGSQTSDLVGKFEPGPLGAVDAGIPKCMRPESPNVIDDPTFCPMDNAAGSGGSGMCALGGAGGGGGSSPGGLVGLGSGAAIDAAGVGGSSFPTAGVSGSSVGAGGVLASNAGTSAPAAPTSPAPSAGAVTGGAAAPSVRDQGTLDVSFTTLRPIPNQEGTFDATFGAPIDNGAVWITDTKGRLVKTLERWGTMFFLTSIWEYTKPFFTVGCQIDAMSHATADFANYKPHKIRWSGHNFANKLAKDGDYVLWIDMQFEEKTYIPAAKIMFHKGREPWTRQEPDKAPHMGLTLTYTPQ